MDRNALRVPLDAKSLRHELRSPWRHIEVVEETGSTNADLLARAAAGDRIDGIVLIAEHQTAGHGRIGRSWSDAPRGGIALSAGISAADVPTERWGWLPLATGVAVVDAVAETTDVRPTLKWPNDAMANGGKLAGILAEVAAPDKVVVVGVGLNVTLSADEAGDPAATSLLDLGVSAPDRTELTHQLLRELGARITQWRNGGGAGDRLMADYLARSSTIGSRVRVVMPGDREVVGIARSIDDQGRLCIESDGQTTAVSAGDVVNLRPTP
jgi:BirA family transcriptional regulator, biotin operon repressor / biotin---[acetyl-CoA-carboxylase] ligase